LFERELKRGNEFLEYQKKIMNRGRLLSVSLGNYVGSIPPYGYTKTVVMEGKRKCPTLKINEDEANIVRIIFDLYVNKDMGCPNIARYLDEHGVSAPKGDMWSPAAIKDMLTNIHYIGKVKWNWRKTVTVVKDSKIFDTRPKAQNYLIYPGKHEAIIPEELFNAAEEKRGRNHRAKGTTKVRNPFASLLYCQCGRAMTLRTYVKNGRPRSAPRLLCDNQVHCGTPSCTYEEFELLIIDILKKTIHDFKLELVKDNSNECIMHQKLIDSLEHKLKTAKQKELSQWEQYTSPDSYMPEHIFKKLNEQTLREINELKQALDTAQKTAPVREDYQKKIDKLSSALDHLSDSSVSAEEKNRLLKACIDKILYNRETNLPRRGGTILLDVNLRV